MKIKTIEDTIIGALTKTMNKKFIIIGWSLFLFIAGWFWIPLLNVIFNFWWG